MQPGKVYERIDWPLLVMFIGLFIVVAMLVRGGGRGRGRGYRYSYRYGRGGHVHIHQRWR